MEIIVRSFTKLGIKRYLAKKYEMPIKLQRDGTVLIDSLRWGYYWKMSWGFYILYYKRD